MYLHIDIDSLFVSTEYFINPKLNAMPIGVGSPSNLEIFNRKRTNITLMNNNSGAFVTLVFYSDKKRLLSLFL